MPPAIYEFGKFRLYIKKKQLFRHDGQLVSLAPRPFELLLFLIENKGTTFSNEELLDKVWGKDISVEKGNVTQNISTINIALEDQKVPHKFIVNVHKRGYYFNEDAVRVIEDKDLEDYLKKEHFLTWEFVTELPEEDKFVFRSENEAIQAGQEESQVGFNIAGQTEKNRELEVITAENKNSSDKENKDREPAAISYNHQKKRRDSDKFNKWLLDYDNSLMRVALACFVVTLVSSVFVSLFIPRFSLTIVSGIQAAIIFVAALFPIRFREGFETTRDSEEFWNSLSEREKKRPAAIHIRNGKIAARSLKMSWADTKGGGNGFCCHGLLFMAASSLSGSRSLHWIIYTLIRTKS